MFKKIIFILSIALILHVPGNKAVFSSDIFSFDDPLRAKNLRVDLRGVTSRGTSWRAREVSHEDMGFLVKLRANPEVMQYFGSGGISTEETTRTRANDWIKRFADGRPHGALIILTAAAAADASASSATAEERAGYVVLGASEEGAGSSEISYVFDPACWGQGLASAVVGTITSSYAREVRRIGSGGGDLNPHEDGPIISAFACFGGEPLRRIHATARPVNKGSWRVLQNSGFRHDISKEPGAVQASIAFRSRHPEEFERSISALVAPSPETYFLCVVDEAPTLVKMHRTYGSPRFYYSQDVY